MACHRSRSLGAGARISRRCRSLASICHCSRNRSICLTLTTIPSPTPYRAKPATLQIYRITLRISPWLRFRLVVVGWLEAPADTARTVGTGFGATWPRARATPSLAEPGRWRSRPAWRYGSLRASAAAVFCLAGDGNGQSGDCVWSCPFQPLAGGGSESGVRDVRSSRSLAPPGASWRFGS